MLTRWRERRCSISDERRAATWSRSQWQGDGRGAVARRPAPLPPGKNCQSRRLWLTDDFFPSRIGLTATARPEFVFGPRLRKSEAAREISSRRSEQRHHED